MYLVYRNGTQAAERLGFTQALQYAWEHARRDRARFTIIDDGPLSSYHTLATIRGDEPKRFRLTCAPEYEQLIDGSDVYDFCYNILA